MDTDDPSKSPTPSSQSNDDTRDKDDDNNSPTSIQHSLSVSVKVTPETNKLNLNQICLVMDCVEMNLEKVMKSKTNFTI